MATANETVKKVLNNLNQRISSVGGVVDKWSDGNGNWWRRYADGFILQGGVKPKGSSSGTITLNIAFMTVNYTVLATDVEDSSPDTGGVDMVVMLSNRTPTSFRYSIDSVRYVSWFACGY